MLGRWSGRVMIKQMKLLIVSLLFITLAVRDKILCSCLTMHSCNSRDWFFYHFLFLFQLRDISYLSYFSYFILVSSHCEFFLHECNCLQNLSYPLLYCYLFTCIAIVFFLSIMNFFVSLSSLFPFLSYNFQYFFPTILSYYSSFFIELFPLHRHIFFRNNSSQFFSLFFLIYSFICYLVSSFLNHLATFIDPCYSLHFHC